MKQLVESFSIRRRVDRRLISVKTTKPDQKNLVSMDGSEIQKALDSSVELQITVTGRKSGREFSTPVWFVREGKTVYLMPVRLEESMVQECLEIETNQDLIGESIPRTCGQTYQRFETSWIHSGQVQEEARSSGR